MRLLKLHLYIDVIEFRPQGRLVLRGYLRQDIQKWYRELSFNLKQ